MILHQRFPIAVVIAFVVSALISFSIPQYSAEAASSKTIMFFKKAKNGKSSKKSHSKKHKSRKIAKKSSCNTKAGYELAVDLMKNSSADLCYLAGIKPAASCSPGSTMTGSINENRQIELADEGEELEELEQEDNVQVDLEMFKTLWLSYVDDTDDNSTTTAGIQKSDMMAVIMDWLGTRYHFGGMSRSGIDCSAFTQMIFNTTAKILLPRTAATQYTVGTPITRFEEMEFGDLVFFNTRAAVYVSHVGVYLGDNLFAHASSKYGVTVSSLKSNYYSSRLIGVRRITEKDLSDLRSTHISKNLASK